MSVLRISAIRMSLGDGPAFIGQEDEQCRTESSPLRLGRPNPQPPFGVESSCSDIRTPRPAHDLTWNDRTPTYLGDGVGPAPPARPPS